MWRALVAASLLGGLICVGCLYVAMSRASHSLQETLCASNLTKLHHALIQYDAAHGSLPPAWIADANGTPKHSWRILVLPHLDAWGIDGETISDRYNFQQSWDSKANRSLIKPVDESRFACPCGLEHGTTLTSYVVPVGPATLFPGAEGVALSDVPEDHDPILLIEITNSDICWSEPRDLSIDGIHLSTETNCVELTKSHGATIRYATVKGRFGTLPSTDVKTLLQMCQSGIPAAPAKQSMTTESN